MHQAQPELWDREAEDTRGCLYPSRGRGGFRLWSFGFRILGIWSQGLWLEVARFKLNAALRSLLFHRKRRLMVRSESVNPNLKPYTRKPKPSETLNPTP